MESWLDCGKSSPFMAQQFRLVNYDFIYPDRYITPIKPSYLSYPTIIIWGELTVTLRICGRSHQPTNLYFSVEVPRTSHEWDQMETHQFFIQLGGSISFMCLWVKCTIFSSFQCFFRPTAETPPQKIHAKTPRVAAPPQRFKHWAGVQ